MTLLFASLSLSPSLSLSLSSIRQSETRGRAVYCSCLKRQLRWEVQGWHHWWSVLKSNAPPPKRSEHLCSRTAVSVLVVSNWHLLPWLLLTRNFLVEKISCTLPRAQQQFVQLWIDLILSRWDKCLLSWITICPDPEGTNGWNSYSPIYDEK